MKKWIKWALVIIGIISLLVVTFIFMPRYNFETGQWCFRKGGYCVYNDIPSGLLFTSPKDDLWGVSLNIQIDTFNSLEGLSEYIIRENSSWICKDTLESPKIVDYFYQICGPSLQDGGCRANKRSAIICGEIYYVIDSDLSRGSSYYGLLVIGEKPEIFILYQGEEYENCIQELKDKRLGPADDESTGAIRYDKYDSPWIKNSEGLWKGFIGVYFTKYRHDETSKSLPLGTILNETDEVGELWTWKKTTDIAWSGFSRQAKNKTSEEVDKFPEGIFGTINASLCDLDILDISSNFSLSS
jgi:hypothetical protein